MLQSKNRQMSALLSYRANRVPEEEVKEAEETVAVTPKEDNKQE